MNIIKAIKKARKLKCNVINTKSFSYTYADPFGITHSDVSIAPGLINPGYLLTLIGRINEQDLLSDIWDVEILGKTNVYSNE